MPIGTWLNGGTVAQLRGLPFLALTGSGQVGAGTVTSDAGGGGVTVWTYGSAVPCRIDPMGSNESVVADRLSDRSTHLVTCPAGTTITTNDRFLVAGDGTYEVTAVQSRTDDALTFFEAVKAS